MTLELLYTVAPSPSPVALPWIKNQDEEDEEEDEDLYEDEDAYEEGDEDDLSEEEGETSTGAEEKENEY